MHIVHIRSHMLLEDARKAGNDLCLAGRESFGKSAMILCDIRIKHRAMVRSRILLVAL